MKNRREWFGFMVEVLLVNRLEDEIGDDSGCRLASQLYAELPDEAYQVDRHREQSG
jgi:hypothetical protein